MPDVYVGASSLLNENGPMIFPTQYETKNMALVMVRLVEPPVLADISDMIIEKDAV